MTLLNYLQDAADEHATLLGVGVKALHGRDLTWVLSRLHLSVERYAGPGETLLVRTWPSTRGSLFTCREFEVLDEAALVVARATTSWAVTTSAGAGRCAPGAVGGPRSLAGAATGPT